MQRISLPLCEYGSFSDSFITAKRSGIIDSAVSKKKDYILAAGYVNQKESLEEAAIRECREEIGRKLISLQYLKSAYYEPSNTLMCCFVAVADKESLADISTWEIDVAKWFSFDEALQAIKPNSLAKHFFISFLNNQKAYNE